ncbi:MAG: hypothetical protein QGG60_09865, partial [Anaerolineales bacterium]|nr:hypothetical protein [Anaerolineales bacterium]
SGRGKGSSSACALGTTGVRVAVGDGVNVTVGVCVCVGALVSDGEDVIVGVRALGGSGGGRVDSAAAAMALSVVAGRMAVSGGIWQALNPKRATTAHSSGFSGSARSRRVTVGLAWRWGWESMWRAAARL